MTVNPCKKANETFGSFISNSIGDPYVEPAKYHLRSNSFAEKPFINMHGNRTVAKSEFVHMHNGRPRVHTPEKAKGVHIKKDPEPFTNLNNVGYTEDPYERKEDIIRDEYSLNNSKILLRN